MRYARTMRGAGRKSKLSAPLDRRTFLKLSGFATLAGVSPVVLTACGPHPKRVADDPGARWMYTSRIAGIDLSYDADKSIDDMFDAVVLSGASVIEGDSDLSNYLSDDAFEDNAHYIEVLAQKAHDRNLKLIWYFPSLEVITLGGEAGAHSMAKDHADWVQINIDQKPNVFYGNKEHWVDEGAESAWMCHNSPYREYFFARVMRLVRAGVDALWLDVPVFMDTVLRWMCVNPACAAKFKSDTVSTPRSSRRTGATPPGAAGFTGATRRSSAFAWTSPRSPNR